MAYSKKRLREIYDRTSGKCHICGKKRYLKNYNRPGERGACHVEHSNARANGGTDRRNNLYVACIDCNLKKGTRSTKSARAKHGRTRAPLSREKRAKAKTARGAVGLVAGGLIGARVAGPPGALVGAIIGSAIGYGAGPDDD